MKKNRSKKKYSIYFLLLFLLIACLQNFSQTAEPFSINKSPLPPPTAPVNDYAGVLDSATISELNRKLIKFRDSTNPSVEIGVAIVKTTGNRPIFDYSLAVARGWGIGSKEADNPSALLFIAIDDRKYFTQVSRDLEDELPDGLVGSLQRQNLVPAFKRGDYAAGVEDTIDAYIKTIEDKQNGITPAETPQDNVGSRRRNTGSEGNFFFCLIILFIIMIFIFSRFGGGGRGGRGGGSGGSGIGNALLWGILSGLASGGGRNSSSGWGGGNSGGWSGGSSGGGGWGGFGGGGSFGGGGAGGGW